MCASHSPSQQCAVVMTSSHKAALFALQFLNTHASQNTGGVKNVTANLETVKQQNCTKFANFNTCHYQRNTEVFLHT